MNQATKILKSIERLEAKKPSEWNAPLIIQVKNFLFPLIKDYVKATEEFYNAEPDHVELADEVFKNDDKKDS